MQVPLSLFKKKNRNKTYHFSAFVSKQRKGQRKLVLRLFTKKKKNKADQKHVYEKNKLLKKNKRKENKNKQE